MNIWSHTIFEPVRLDDFLRLVDDVRHVDLGTAVSLGTLVQHRSTYTNDVRRARLGGKHGEDASPAANIEHGLALEEVTVVHDRRPVRARTDAVLEHLLVDTYVVNQYIYSRI